MKKNDITATITVFKKTKLHNSSITFCLILILVMFSHLLVAANGEEAGGSTSSAHSVWNYRRKLAGKPHPEGVPEGVLPGFTGHTLPGCWAGRKSSLIGFRESRTQLFIGFE